MDEPIQPVDLHELDRETMLKLGSTSLVALLAALAGTSGSAEAESTPKPHPRASSIVTSIPLGLDFTDTAPPPTMAKSHATAGTTPVTAHHIMVAKTNDGWPSTPTVVYQISAPFLNGIVASFKMPKSKPLHFDSDTVYVAVWT
ncbi:MAG TPA: hypothetical protein VHS78_12610 [Candidatus Elarobacter sp.]|jgi:hypothetical protein|nr:hypothetical protein [Candidatus Elarobacter sp.]